MKTHYFFPIIMTLILCIGFSGCKDNSGPEMESGRIKIITITQGENTDGYDVRIQGEQQTHIAANDTLISENLNDGMYKVELLELPEKCSVIGVNPATVEVEDTQEATVTFEVNCEETQMATGSFEVITNTSPENSGYSFALLINGTDEYDIAANDTLTFNNQEYGSYTLKLNDVPENCTVEGENPQLVQIENEEKVITTFELTCHITGSLEIYTNTSTINSKEIYSLSLDGEQFKIGANDYLLIENLEPRNYQVKLDSFPSTCSVRRKNPREITVTTEYTVDLSFDLFCQTIFDYKFIAKSTGFEDRTSLYFLYPDSHKEEITQVFGGINGLKLSPDGSKVAFTAVPPHIPHIYEDELYLMNSDGTNIQKITEYPADPEIYNFAWAPDSESLLFSGRFEETETSSIFSIDTDGSDLIQLTNHPDSSDKSPSWAPDGSKIVFHRRKENLADIYLMDPDGSNLTNITNSPDKLDIHPHWTPNGKKIYFISYLDDDGMTLIYDLGTSQITKLLDSEGNDVRGPVWSPDGTKIAYTKIFYDSEATDEDLPPDTDWGTDIYVMDADGSNPMQLTHTNKIGFINRVGKWSPDGKYIIFTQEPWYTDAIIIYTMNSDGSKINRIGYDGYFLNWLPLD